MLVNRTVISRAGIRRGGRCGIERNRVTAKYAIELCSDCSSQPQTQLNLPPELQRLFLLSLVGLRCLVLRMLMGLTLETTSVVVNLHRNEVNDALSDLPVWLAAATPGCMKPLRTEASVTLKTYIDNHAITGLTSNPTIFEHAISDAGYTMQRFSVWPKRAFRGEELFFRTCTSGFDTSCRFVRVNPPTHSRR